MDAAPDAALSRSASPASQVGDDSTFSRTSLLREYTEEEEEEEADDDSSSLSGSGRDSHSPDEAVFDNDQAHADDERPHSSPDTSPQHSDDDGAWLAAGDSRRGSCDPGGETVVMHGADEAVAAPSTPQKQQRSPFRNPSSVRAIQLDTTPPHLVSGSARHRYRISATSRNSTPRSTRSFQSAARRSSPTKQKKEYPLVLLHVSLLPVACPYSAAVLESVLPEYTIQNWTLLQEKVSQTVLDRGILIPHPREDYDLLEERLLESLELKAPRILKCGHFHMSPEEVAEIAASEDEYDSDDQDLDICDDCGRRIRDGRFGTGSGQQRWSIKVYASNGLMRAGAWSAAWQEMERVDVEILPWLDDQMRRELDLRRDEELAVGAQHSPAPTMDEQRRKEIYGEDAAVFGEGFAGDHGRGSAGKELPLMDLLSVYVHRTFQDRRNLAIALLTLAVLFLAIGAGAHGQQGALPSPLPAELIVTPETPKMVAGPTLVETSTVASMSSIMPEVAVVAEPLAEEMAPQSVLAV